ncbi:MAG: S-adenosylmethionine--diacylglycerol 3-amino-3-carboxypropyl transferase [Erythrobacter sp.]|nr:MAG: S-adenosylmethionine--diacylglycerol 3-amino-3-carboxypropyl transferase [Erythrobacter sp.]
MATQAKRIIEDAVVRKEAGLGDKLLDKAFALAFRGLVYAQIWEDPVVDMDGLAITPESRVMCIASGSCNALSYLTAGPASVTAVDLNRAHVALGRLKIAAIRHLPNYERFHRFFAQADHKENAEVYRTMIAPHLDAESRAYWEARDIRGRRRISYFTKGLYKQGLLGNFIGLAHVFARLYKIDLGKLLAAETLEEQRAVFERELAPVFEKRFIRWLTDQPASLFGLGIPPAQFAHLAGDERMAEVLRRRLEKLACDFAVKDNYFAWQAFGRGYSRAEGAPLPPYLQRANWEAMRARIDRIAVTRANMVDWIGAREEPASIDRFVLLDAQDWMNNAQLDQLWSRITRASRPGARVLFRTAAEPSLLPGRLDDAILSQWRYLEALSADLTRRDRSSIYGGVHVYELA